MSYTYDPKPTATYNNDGKPIPESLYGTAKYGYSVYGGLQNAYDIKPTGDYSYDVKP